MLKTLKWVYDLGVRQERVRIATHLRLEVQRAGLSRDTRLDMINENSPKLSKSRRDKLAFAMEVDTRVQDVINNIFADNGGHWEHGASLMFPDDKHKGEI